MKDKKTKLTLAGAINLLEDIAMVIKDNPDDFPEHSMGVNSIIGLLQDHNFLPTPMKFEDSE